MHAHFEHISFSKIALQETGSGCSSGSESIECDSYSNRKVSDVWKYFTQTSDKIKAVCSICWEEIAYSGGTTNLRDHLASKHMLQYFSTSRATSGSKTIALDGFVKSSKCSENCVKSIMDKVS